jgi:hypothetical protein
LSLKILRSSASLTRTIFCGIGLFAMITESQIREQLFAYLIRDVTLNDFEDWLVSQSWNMHLDSSDAAQQLVGAIELRLAEYSDDHLNDSGLERELAGLLAPSIVASFQDEVPDQPIITRTASSGSARAFSIPSAQAA